MLHLRDEIASRLGREAHLNTSGFPGGGSGVTGERGSFPERSRLEINTSHGFPPCYFIFPVPQVRKTSPFQSHSYGSISGRSGTLFPGFPNRRFLFVPRQVGKLHGRGGEHRCPWERRNLRLYSPRQWLFRPKASYRKTPRTFGCASGPRQGQVP